MTAIDGRTALGDPSVQELAESLRGEVLRDGDAGYDDARTGWNAIFHDARPDLVVRCAGASDVIAAVRFARSAGLDIAVKGGGHSVPGFSTIQGGMLIDLGPMDGVRVDPVARRAVVQGGCRWRDVDAETQEFGLATTGGLVSDTGVAGYTLGGGIGHLMRKHGLAIDNLVGADVVTADGRFVHTSETEEPELFWGLRGGGGNFGIVTAFEFELHSVGPMVYGGPIFFAGEDAQAVLTAFAEWTGSGLPDEISALANVLVAPPVPFLPPEHHGKQICAVIFCHSGDHADGERLLAPIRAAATPIADLGGPIPYAALNSLIDALFPKGGRYYMRSGYLEGMTGEAVSAMVATHLSTPLPGCEIHVHDLGGAVARVDANATAFGDRSAPYAINIVGTWQDAADDEANLAWMREAGARLDEFCTGAVYSNFMGSEGEDRTKSAYGEKLPRLQALKRAWDPDNVFNRNQNVKP
jgi:FAD/FMN-containing dehydrogenase